MRIKELIKKLEEQEKSLEKLKIDSAFILSRLENVESWSSDGIKDYIAKRIIEESEMSSMPFETIWERISKDFCDQYESKITQITEDFQNRLALMALARMNLIEQLTVSKLEKFSNEAIEIVKNKESKNE